MPLFKSLQAPNGAMVAFHKVMQVNYDVARQVVNANVASWVSQDDHNSGSGLVWMWALEFQPSALADLDAALLAQEPFTSGTIVSDTSTSLDALKTQTWARIKDKRDQAINGGFQWTGSDGVVSTFDSDLVAQSRIAGAFSLATNATTSAIAFPKLWKLADNTTRMLSSADMISVGATLAGFVQGHIDQGDTLLSSITAAADAATLEAISWPT